MGSKFKILKIQKKYLEIILQYMFCPNLRSVEWKLWSVADRKGFQGTTNRLFATPVENITNSPLLIHPPHSTTRPKGLVYLALRARSTRPPGSLYKTNVLLPSASRRLFFSNYYRNFNEWKLHPFFYKNQHTFWKGYIKNRNVLNAF